MKRAPVYDIRTSENAWNTLVALTGVAPQIWERMLLHRSEYRWEGDLVEDVVRRYGQVPPRYEEWTFTYKSIYNGLWRAVRRNPSAEKRCSNTAG